MSAGALRRLHLCCASTSSGEGAVDLHSDDKVRRLSVDNMLWALWSLELRALRLISVSCVGEVVWVRGTTRVVTRSSGERCKSGDLGGNVGLAYLSRCMAGWLRVRSGILSLPTPIEGLGRLTVIGVISRNSTTSGLAERGSKRAEIWSREGNPRGLTLSHLGCLSCSPGNLKSTCSTRTE